MNTVATPSAQSQEKSTRRCLVGFIEGKWREPTPTGYYQRGTIRMKVRCGRWDCETCGPKKARRLWKRAHNGKIAEAAHRAGFRDKYSFKLLTLTWGGLEQRQGISPAAAAKEMSRDWSNLTKAIREEYGDFMYLKVFEKHKDGWPHLHVLLVGSSIAPKGVRDYIERLWRQKYGRGFIKINISKESGIAAVRYVMKYLFKDPHVFTGVHMFSASREALEKVRPRVKRVWDSFRYVSGEKWEDAPRFYDLLGELGEQEVTIGFELLPVQGVPF